MKKIIILATVIALILTWNYMALSQRANELDEGTEIQGESTQSTEVDNLAKDIIIQQQESRENLRRLAEGQIKSIEFGAVDTNSRQINIVAFYNDQTTLNGRLDLTEVGEKYYLSRITRDDALPNLPGQQVASLTESEMILGRELVNEQGNDQAVYEQLLKGQVRTLVVNNIVKQDKSEVLEMTEILTDGTTHPVKVEMVFESGFWYVKSVKVQE